MPTLLQRIRTLLAERRAERELAEELETHRQLIEQRMRASGLSQADAVAASRRAMGNATLAREDARAVWFSPRLDALRQDVVYAFRLLLRAPSFAAAMIVVMALGIGATTAVFGLLDGVVLRKLPVHHPDRLVYFTRPSFSYPIYSEVGARSGHVFSELAAWDMERAYVAWNTELEPAEVLMASGTLFSTLGVGAAIGRTFGPDDDRIGGGRGGLIAVITDAAWGRRFNRDPAAIGRTLRVDRHIFTIVGVTPPGFFGVAPGLAPEVILPLTSTATPDRLQSQSSSWVHLIARLRDGVSLDEANVALRAFWPAVLQVTTSTGMSAERRAVYLARTTQLDSARAGYSRVRNQFGEPLWLLLVLGTLLLAVACTSAANLLLARGVARSREIAVRLALGASRGRLVRQMFTESLVWTILASAAGLLLAVWAGAALVALMSTSQETIVVDLSINWRLLAFATIMAFVTSACCSVLPALFTTSLAPAATLKETAPTASQVGGRWSIGKALVAAQVAFTVLLLFGASLFTRSVARVLAQDAGVDRDRVLVVSTDPVAAGYSDDRLAGFYQQLLDRLTRIDDVQAASLSLYPPISGEDGAWTQSIAIDGNPVPETPGQSAVYFNAISPGYLQTVGIALVHGRDFADIDTAASPRVVIVNESLARRFFPAQNALGRLITLGRSQNRRSLQIVGIVRDAKYQRLEEQPRSIAYLPHAQHPIENLFAEVRVAGPLAAVADRIRKEVRSLDAVVPMRIETIEDRIRESLVTERVIATIATTLGLAALALACAGLYGMLAYAVSRRQREIGVRLALGAERFAVLRMVVGESLSLAAIGVLAGLAAALALGRFARSLLFGVSPTDPFSLAAAALLMLLVAALAGLLPARRASRVDPVRALRSE